MQHDIVVRGIPLTVDATEPVPGLVAYRLPEEHRVEMGYNARLGNREGLLIAFFETVAEAQHAAGLIAPLANWTTPADQLDTPELHTKVAEVIDYQTRGFMAPGRAAVRGRPVSAPARIQRRRTKGWRKPDGAVIVDRTSAFGNPFRVDGPWVVAPDGAAWQRGDGAGARRHAVVRYRRWLNGIGPDVYTTGRRTYDRSALLAALPELAGRDLVCPCPAPLPGEPDHCHATVLLELANAGTEVSR